MKRTHIVLLLLVAGLMGTFIATVTSEPVEYYPQVNTSLTRFHMMDKEGVVREVWLEKAKPTGLERSESIDLYGRADGEHFRATDMLMKCPSKYNEQNHLLDPEA